MASSPLRHGKNAKERGERREQERETKIQKLLASATRRALKQFHDRILLVRDLCIYDFTGKQGLTHCLLNFYVSITKFQISHFINPVLSLETIPKLKRNFLAKNFVRPHRGSQVNVWC